MNSAEKEQKYNGWSNHETWLASLWLGENETSYSVLVKAIKIAGESFDKANWLEARLRRQLDCEIETACLWQDILRLAFDRINWIEVIEKNLE